MKPNAKQLAMRDPALALLVGAIGESDFGVEFGQDNDDDEDFPNTEFGADYGFEFGDDWGSDGAPAAAPQAQMQKWKQRAAHTSRRAMLLEPNKHSDIKVERYSFNLNASLVLGTASAIDSNGSPDTNLRPQRVSMNAPVPGFVTVSDLKVANVSVIVGGSADAFQYNANGVGQSLDMPTLSPANRARVQGSYTGITPVGYTATNPFTFCVGLTGPASIVA